MTRDADAAAWPCTCSPDPEIGECERSEARREAQPTVGSLCMGYGGLELALEDVLDARPVWCSEIDKHACKVIEARFPGVPNHGDLKSIDWSRLERVDILTAGYPCQPFSVAGNRKGVDDPRHLWPYICDALRVLRPRVAIFENVDDHLALGFDQVLADLAGIRFDADWTVVRASEVGACHQRARLFFVATNAGSAGAGWDATGAPGPQEPARRGAQDETDSPVAGRPVAADTCGERHGGGQDTRGVGRLDGEDAIEALERQWSRPVTVDRGAAPEWGVYEAAVRRHEHALGRSAPRPLTDDGKLSPRFTEWMMMLPAGWVSDVSDLTRNQMIKIIGNGVVPAAATHALRHLLTREDVAA